MSVYASPIEFSHILLHLCLLSRPQLVKDKPPTSFSHTLIQQGVKKKKKVGSNSNASTENRWQTKGQKCNDYGFRWEHVYPWETLWDGKFNWFGFFFFSNSVFCSISQVMSTRLEDLSCECECVCVSCLMVGSWTTTGRHLGGGLFALTLVMLCLLVEHIPA